MGLGFLVRSALPSPASALTTSPTGVPAVAAPPDAGSTAPYVIQPLDSLWDIAETQMGDPLEWETIWEINRSNEPPPCDVEDPNKIYSGCILQLPAPQHRTEGEAAADDAPLDPPTQGSSVEAQESEDEGLSDRNATGTAAQTEPQPEEPLEEPSAAGDLEPLLARPIPHGRVTSQFGPRLHPIYGDVRTHTGVDLAAADGTPVHAAADGVVVSAGWMGGYGIASVIEHGSELTTLYAHLSSVAVSAGEQVHRSEVIGLVGCTGSCTGPHLHFEVWVAGTPVDPSSYLE
jgi:murein DD-endopeptidase MepM/ murein hydrolase activator NlpD